MSNVRLLLSLFVQRKEPKRRQTREGLLGFLNSGSQGEPSDQKAVSPLLPLIKKICVNPSRVINSMRFISTVFLLGCLLFVPSYVLAQEVGLTFSPDSTTIKKNDQTTVVLHLSPVGQKVIGVDVKLTFDPFYVEVVEIKNKDAFSSLLGTQINNTLGSAKFSLVNEFNKFQTTNADIVEVVLRGKNVVSSTRVTMDFERGKTQDTNVALSGGLDVLGFIDDITVKIEESTSEEPDKSSPSPTITPTPKPVVVASPRPKFPGIISPLPDEGNGRPEQPGKSRVLGEIEPGEAGVTFDFVPEAQGFPWVWVILFGLIGLFITIQLVRKYLLRTDEKPVYSS